MIKGEERQLLAQHLKKVAEQVIADNWKLPGDGGWQWVGSSEGARVARIMFCGEEFYFKAFLPRGLLEPIKALWRGSRAQRFCIQTKVLELHGFLAPNVIVGEIKGSVPWVIMESAPGVAWGDYVCSFLTDPKARARLFWKRKLIHALGVEVGRLHKLGIVHGDINPFNVLIDASDERLRFHFIDNERSRRPLFLLERERIRNLVQINFFRSPHMRRTDLLRFWGAYCDSAGLSQSYQRRLLIKVYRNLMVRLVIRSV